MQGASLVALLVAIVSGLATVAVGALSLKANAKSTAATAEVQQGANVLEGYDELTKNQAERIKSQELRIEALDATVQKYIEREAESRKAFRELHKELDQVRAECSSCRNELDTAWEVIENLRQHVEDDTNPEE